jgi:hypothetical protein
MLKVNTAIRIVMLLMLAVFHWHCHTTKEAAGNGYCSSVMLEKGGCMQNCKTYTIKIDESGRADYTGKVNVSKTGSYYRMLGSQEKTALWECIKRNDIYNFTGFTGNAGEDSQMRLLILVKDGVEKRISYGELAPKPLMNVEDKIEEIAESGEWQKH